MKSSIGRVRPATVSGVDSGEHEDEPGRRAGSRLNCLADVVSAEWLREPVGLLADLDAAGGVAEDLPGLPAEGKQRAQRDQQLDPARAGQVIEGGQDVVAGDLAQVVIAR